MRRHQPSTLFALAQFSDRVCGAANANHGLRMTKAQSLRALHVLGMQRLLHAIHLLGFKCGNVALTCVASGATLQFDVGEHMLARCKWNLDYYLPDMEG